MGRIAESGARIRSLDGLRAVAVLLVLASHVRVSRRGPPLDWLPFDGPSGVCLFFIISGFLITWLLLDEKDRHGAVSLPLFYARRAIRIVPACYAFLLAMLAARALGGVHFTNLSALSSATWWRNYYSGGDWVLDHMWSLSVEEQFYLLWPGAVWLLSRRNAMWAAVGLMFVWPVLRWVRHGVLLDIPARESLALVGMDAIFCGALLALYRHRPRSQTSDDSSPPQRSVESASNNDLRVLAIAISLWLLYAGSDHLSAHAGALWGFARNALMTLLVDVTVRAPGRYTSRLLDARPMAWLGTISYSLYLWQQPLLIPDQQFGWIGNYPQNLLAAVVLALVSYFLIERPLNSYRRRFAPGPKRLVVQSAPPRAVANL